MDRLINIEAKMIKEKIRQQEQKMLDLLCKKLGRPVMSSDFKHCERRFHSNNNKFDFYYQGEKLGTISNELKSKEKLPISSYHGVKVVINDVPYDLFSSVYGLNLTCDRTSGFELWFKAGMPDGEKVGGEYDEGCHFQIYFGENLVFDNKNK